ncbi:MAG: fused MFS/spermidine synthase [Gemmataceae bacterium]
MNREQRTEDWFILNRQRIEARTRFQADFKQGVVHERPKSMHQLRVERRADQLQLFFYGPDSREVLSRMDVHDPLNLVSPYTQAMVLTLLWQSDPKFVYMLGFGAGRVPMILHHYFPDVRIDCTELDEDVVAVAQSHFGVAFDDRLQLAIQDGREYLEQREPATQYDVIFLDAFRGTGSSPFPLSTREFYDLCKSHLARDGVVATNLLSGDPLFRDKVTTVVHSFPCVYLVLVDFGASILFGSQGEPVLPSELLTRANAIQSQHGFVFPFLEHARNLRLVTLEDLSLAPLYQGRILTDETPPTTFPLPKSVISRVRRDDPCPCGSGKTYRTCHGSETSRL